MINKPLKTKLVESLLAIRKHANDAQGVGPAIEALNRVTIPENDYQNVTNFILLLLREKPYILEADPDNALLRQLCLECLEQASKIEGPKVKRKG